MPKSDIKVGRADEWLLDQQAWHLSGSYYRGWVGSKHTYLHHCIVGRPLPGYVVDHINGDTQDNRRCNLQVVTQSENILKGKTHRGGTNVRGVSWNKRDKVWQVTFKIKMRAYNFGNFKSFSEACAKAQEVYHSSIRHG